jgi:hypothetical protein
MKTARDTPQSTAHIKKQNNHANQQPPPSNKLTVKKQFFQMRKMDQR